MASGTGLATAFYRFYILDALERGPARAASLLAALHAREGVLPLPAGGFSRALQQLLDAGLVGPGPEGAMQLTAFGARERESQRALWQQLIGVASRVLAGDAPTGEAAGADDWPVELRSGERVAEGYRERVVVAELRDALRAARDDGRRFSLFLGQLSVAHGQPARAKAMVHRALRETLREARAVFGADASALRYGMSGVALICRGDGNSGAELLRARLTESLATMVAGVRAYAGARYGVRVGGAAWTPAISTSQHMLRLAEEALARDDARCTAA
jgi:hypothetical protein